MDPVWTPIWPYLGHIWAVQCCNTPQKCTFPREVHMCIGNPRSGVCTPWDPQMGPYSCAQRCIQRCTQGNTVVCTGIVGMHSGAYTTVHSAKQGLCTPSLTAQTGCSQECSQ